MVTMAVFFYSFSYNLVNASDVYSNYTDTTNMVDLFSNKEVLRTQPNPEDNGKIFVVAEIIPNLEPVKMSNVAVNPEAANMTFDKKNLIYGFSIIPESSSFNPSENQLYWGLISKYQYLRRKHW